MFNSPPLRDNRVFLFCGAAAAAVSQAAREVAEERVRALEDRLAALGREEEKASLAEAGAAEEATARARDKVSAVVLRFVFVFALLVCLLFCWLVCFLHDG